jgi:autotransporter strand-loop-strand O-heptosyltransferase
LGDTLAWVPAVEEFRKKHGCRVFCASKFSELFENSYPEITFLSHGEFVPNIVAMYEIGWFHENGEPDLDRVPVNFRTQPMQKVAFDIMGISYQETLPLINLPPVSRKKKISIAMHATLQAKYWNNPTGWQDVVDWSRSQGFEVVLVSSEVPGHMGNSAPEGTKWLKNASILRVAEEIASSSAFLGVGSGLSWLAWATKTPTVIVSGFSENYTEPTTNVRRISSPSGKCSGCFNRYQHEHNNWKWCPDHAGTSRMFECSKNIESREVIQQLQELLNNESYNS